MQSEMVGSTGSELSPQIGELARAPQDRTGFSTGKAIPSARTLTPAEKATAEQTNAGQVPQESLEQAVAELSGAEQARAAGAETEQIPSEPAPNLELLELWSALELELRKRIKHEQFATWFRRIALRDVNAEAVRLVVQNSFAKDWLESNYRPALERSVAALFGAPRSVTIEVDPELSIAAPAARDPRDTQASTGAALDLARTAGSGGSDAGPISTGLLSPGSASTSQLSSSASPTAPATARGHAFELERNSPLQQTPAGVRDHSGREQHHAHNGLAWESDVALNPNYRFDNFVVGPCNRFAHAAAVGVSESPGKSYNPFFLHGSVGLGKTHLLQSMCYALLDHAPQTRILFLSCETFVNHFIAALGNGNLGKFRNKYRNVDVLVVDDIHMLANKERTQEEFFHTFNSLYNGGKQIVLSSDSSPKEIPTLQERLVSRFKWGLVTEIEAPCYETRMAILKRKSRERGCELPDPVAQLVAEYVDNNIRELEGAVNRLISYANLSHQELTIDLARKVLRDLFSAPRGQPAMEDVLRIVTAHYNIKVTELQSRKRTKAIAFPRQIGMYLARKITRHSLEEIGGFFGGRDHTTVLYAVEQIEKQMHADERLRASVASFLSQLQR